MSTVQETIKFSKLNENVAAAKMFNNPDGSQELFVVLKNPTEAEFWKLMKHSKNKQLRGIIGSAEGSPMFVWDAYYGTHDKVYDKMIAGKSPEIDHDRAYLLFTPNNMNIFGFSKEADKIKQRLYKPISTEGNTKWLDKIVADDDLGLLDKQIDEVLELAGSKRRVISEEEKIEMLSEGVNEVKVRYPLISDDDFNKLIKLDPTYKENDRLGKYSKWILSLYNNFLKDKVAYSKWEEQKRQGKNYPEPIKKSNDNIEDFEKLPDLLKQFDVINKKTKVDISTLKSIAALATVISNEKSKGVSTNSKVNRGIDLFKKSVKLGGKTVFKDTQWIVLVPETLASSVVFGEDTNWCTTSSRGVYYYKYLKEYGGKYFINLNLSTGDLYQFHFESDQLMDSNDKGVQFKDIIKDSKLETFYKDYIMNNYSQDIYTKLISNGFKLSDKEIEKSIDENAHNIRFVNNPSETLKLKAVKDIGLTIKYIDNPSEELQIAAVSQLPYNIKYIKSPTESSQMTVIKKDPVYIQYIKNPTEKVQLTAIRKDPEVISYIKNPTEKVQLTAIKRNPVMIDYIKNPTEKVKQEYNRHVRKNMQRESVDIKDFSDIINEAMRFTKKLTIQLLEGVNEVKVRYPLISDDDFNKLIKLDPTYKGGNELGRYSKWILSLYNKFLKDKNEYKKWEEQKKQGKNYPEPIKKSSDRIEDFEKLPNLLAQFDVINKKAKVDIGTLKSIANLATVVSKEQSKGVSTNSKVNRGIELFKKSVKLGGKVVFKNKQWIVLVPNTLKSSVVFGKDTHWCTTTANGKYYKYYLDEYGGKYFINLDLSTGDLYQFHFESEQYMDSNDEKITIKDVIHDMELKEFYVEYASNLDAEEQVNAILSIAGNLDMMSERNKLALIKEGPLFIEYMSNPSEKIQVAAVSREGIALEYIKNPSEKVQWDAVENDGYAIRYIKNPSEELQLLAVNNYGNSIEYIKKPTEKVQLVAVKNDGYAIRYIKNPTEKVQLAAVNATGKALQYIKNPTEKVQFEAVKNHGYALEYIDNPSEELQLLAVRDRGFAIKYIKNPTEKVQFEAVKQDIDAIEYIDNPSEELQLLAVKDNGYVIQYIKNPCEKAQIEAVKQYPRNIQHIKNPCEEAQIEAVKQDRDLIFRIEKPTKKVENLVNKLRGY